MVCALAGDSTITSDVGIGDSLIATARRLSITSGPGRRIRARRTTWLAERLGELDRAELEALATALPALRRLLEGAS